MRSIECDALWTSTDITGIKTTVPFHAAMMRNGDFRDGNYDTGLIDRLISAGKLNLKSRPLRLHE